MGRIRSAIDAQIQHVLRADAPATPWKAGSVPAVPQGFTCPKCGRTSYNPHDLSNRYCGNCHEFFDYRRP